MHTHPATATPSMADDGAPAAARTLDPSTPHEAAATLPERRRRDTRLRILQYAAARWPAGHTFTLADVVQAYQRNVLRGDFPPVSDSGIRTRLSELQRAGLIADTGKTCTRPGSGRRHRLLTVTPLGRGR